MTPTASGGIIDKPSNHPAQDTLKNLEATLQAKGVKLFSVIDHSGEAEKADLETRPTKLLIFGKPKAGTPVMLASSRSAIDLPLKLLIWEDARGKVRISYNSLSYPGERHGLSKELLANLAVVETLAAQAGA